MTLNKKLNAVSERIRDHLTRQHAVSANQADSCLYRGPNGTTCAVGCLIKDCLYRPGLEESTVAQNAVFQAVTLSLSEDGLTFQGDETQPLLRLLQRWQGYHDSRTEKFAMTYRAWCERAGTHDPAQQHEWIIALLREGGHL